MKGLILAGGYGTRLHPLTEDTAKPLVNVHDTPIITRILERIEHIPFDELYVVTNDKFTDQLRDWAERVDTDHDITVINDGTTENGDRLGTLGDIKYVVNEATIDDDLFVIGGDNLFEFDLKDFINAYNERDGSLIAVKDLKDKEKVAGSFGVVDTDDDNVVTGFEEKPENPSSTLASTLLYALSEDHLSLLDVYLARGYPSDDAGNFIKYLADEARVVAYDFDDAWFDIGTKERLSEAEDYYDK